MRVAISLRSARVISLSLSECVLYPAAGRALPSYATRSGTSVQRELVHVRDYLYKRCSILNVVPSKIASFLAYLLFFFQRNNRAITRYATVNYHELLADSRLSTNTGFDKL